MAHAFRRKRIHTVPVEVSIQRDGSTEYDVYKFNATFEAGKVKDFRGLNPETVTESRLVRLTEALHAHLKSWDLTDADTGEPLECNDENKTLVLEDSPHQIGLLNAWVALSQGQKEKN